MMKGNSPKETFAYIQDEETETIAWFEHLSGKQLSTVDVQRSDFVRFKRSSRKPRTMSARTVTGHQKTDLLRQLVEQGILQPPRLKSGKPALEGGRLWMEGSWTITEYGQSLAIGLSDDAGGSNA